MWITATIIVSLVLTIVIFLSIPFSPVKSGFNNIVDKKIEIPAKETELFTETDLKGLPEPLQRYFRYCRYLGTPKMTYMVASFNNVNFYMSESKIIKINYQQFNLVERPERFALITSSIMGIPFEGLDLFKNGKGSMKGVLAKIIPLFNQQGVSMDRACLVTWLAECLIVPSAALQEFVKWETIDDTKAKAVIEWDGINVSGIFTFRENGELLSFRTSDRTAIDMNGKETKADWSAYFLGYHEVNEILQPKVLQSVWHYQDGDCIYFNQNEREVSIRYQ